LGSRSRSLGSAATSPMASSRRRAHIATAESGTGSNRSTDSSKILTLKSQRLQVQGRLDEWEAQFQRIHHRTATDADRHRSSQHRELRRLLEDVDALIASLDGTAGTKDTQDHRDIQRRAERGRIKARMRRWDREFEKARGRKPTEADHAASSEFTHLQQQLHGSPEGSFQGSHGAEAAAPSAPEMGTELPLPPQAAALTSVSTTPEAAWWQGNDYHELLRARVQSQAAVNGFEGATAAEVHATATTFSHWDLDRDGVLGAEEFALVINSLAQHAGRSVDAETVQRLMALVDSDGNGKVDFNEFLAISRSKLT